MAVVCIAACISIAVFAQPSLEHQKNITRCIENPCCSVMTNPEAGVSVFQSTCIPIIGGGGGI
jgi:hypothetical protein